MKKCSMVCGKFFESPLENVTGPFENGVLEGGGVHKGGECIMISTDG